MATVTTTVSSITAEDLRGCVRRSRSERQLKVPMLTMIITATRAAIGICRTRSLPYTTSTSSSTPATRQDRRPRAPDVTLMTDWPIIAQQAMPPRKPVTVFATPWPTHSRLRSLASR